MRFTTDFGNSEPIRRYLLDDILKRIVKVGLVRLEVILKDFLNLGERVVHS